MKTILVPVDFSPTSHNAASYALQYAKQIGGKIMLIHAYEPPFVYPLYQGIEISPEGMHQIKQREIKLLANQLAELEPLIKVEHMLFEGSLLQVISDITESMQVAFLVMGITGAGKLKETLIGSNAFTVAKKCKIPALIVPENAVFNKINDIGLTTDFRDVASTIPDKLVSELIQATGARLHILNVDFKNRQWTYDTPFQSGLVETMFQQYHPQYHFIDHTDLVEGLNNYVVKFSIELLLVIPQRHNLVEQIFSGSHTKSILFHSKVPVMVLHQQ